MDPHTRSEIARKKLDRRRRSLWVPICRAVGGSEQVKAADNSVDGRVCSCACVFQHGTENPMNEIKREEGKNK